MPETYFSCFFMLIYNSLFHAVTTCGSLKISHTSSAKLKKILKSLEMCLAKSKNFMKFYAKNQSFMLFYAFSLFSKKFMIFYDFMLSVTPVDVLVIIPLSSQSHKL